jgi:hypothetical protein
MKTTKAFERGLESLEMVAPRTSRTWALEVPGSESMRERNLLITDYYLDGSAVFWLMPC